MPNSGSEFSQGAKVFDASRMFTGAADVAHVARLHDGLMGAPIGSVSAQDTYAGAIDRPPRDPLDDGYLAAIDALERQVRELDMLAGIVTPITGNGDQNGRF